MRSLLLYPTDWRALAREIKQACDYRCQECGRNCRRPGQFRLGWEYELAVAHLTQDYHAEAVTVAALCARCHLRYDAPFAWVARRRKAGQLMLITG